MTQQINIAPYIKLMFDKGAERLQLKEGARPELIIDGKALPVGTVTPEGGSIMAIFNTLANDAQRLEYSIEQHIRFAATPYGGQHFIVELDGRNTPLTMMALPDPRKRDDEIKVETKHTVLNEAPTDTLDVMPYLVKTVELGGSDLFLTVGSMVKTKIHGKAVELDNYLLTPELTESVCSSIMTEQQLKDFKQDKDLDFAIALEDGSARFRVNAFYQRGTVGFVFRLIPMKIPTLDDLDLPEVLQDVIMEKRGLLLMVGATGSGKSTSLAAMINHRNQNAAGHILTIEDPVEFSHPNLKSIVNQREVGVDTASYARALKASLREAPDVILIGEIRDRETMEAALELSNTGHLCISTLHANNANQAMERIINMFPQSYHKQLFMDLSANLNAVISQRLVPDTKGKRCAAIEIMLVTPHISNLILKGNLDEVKEAMRNSGTKGMQTFDDALIELVKAGRVTQEEALRNADSRNDMEAKLSFG